MLYKLSKRTLISVLSVFALSTGIATTLGIKANEWINEKNINLVQKSLNTAIQKDDLQPFEQFNESPILTQKAGPIISWGSTIKSLDWFGAVRWEINLLDAKYNNLFPQNKTSRLVEYRNRAFISWDLDVTTNSLWLLMNTSKDTANPPNGVFRNIHASKVVKINSLTGHVDKVYEWKENNEPKTFVNYWALYYQISALSNGNVLLFSQVDGNKRKSVVLDTKTSVFTEHSESGDSVDKRVGKTRTDRHREVRNVFLIPISNNLNILAVLDFNSHGQRTTSNATGDVYLLLVDDNLAIHKTTDSKWQNFIHIPNVFSNWTTRSADPVINRSIYRTFDNKVYFTIYNKFFVVDTKTNAQNGLDFAEYDLANSGRNTTNAQSSRPSSVNDKVNAISSYAVDANENIYYKLINDSTIYNLKISVNKTDVRNTTFASTTYYNLAENSEQIVRENANSFVLFNVTGSTGALFALNAKVINNGEDISKDPNNYKDKNYGLALAIVPSSSDPNVGDVKGLLNTDKKFVQPADFNIDETTLNQKLPSEITRNDLRLLNNGFFTTNNETENGKLKYLPFEIKDIKDETGTFTVVANLDQIPWFSNTLPEGSVPRKIEKQFSGASTISKKVSWVDQNNLSYDFKNTLPSKLTEQDLNSFDLFQANFASQTITQNAQVIYPKKKYSIEEKDDVKGTVKVKVEYEYVPLGVNYQNKSNVLTYSSSHEYQIFKNTDEIKLTFAGQNASELNQEININNTPVLKSFLQSSVLPSSIQGLINSNEIKYTDFLNLAESSGYPTNKMHFSLVADDRNGKLVFNATLENGYYEPSKNAKTSFSQTFSGFNISSSYKFNFKNNIENLSINNLLPSSITQANVLANFVDFSGFDVKDLNIRLIPNDANGELNIEVSLNRLYSSTIGNGTFGFNNYVARKTYTGFLTQQQFNEQFNIEFKDNEDAELATLKQKTLLEINNALVKDEKTQANPAGIEIGEKRYTNLNDLVQKLLIKKQGNQIPTSDWVNNQNIETRMVFDNNAGTVAFFVTIKKEASLNINNDLNFVVSYNDFARGNKVQTQDNLSFISNSNFNELKLANEQKLSLSNFKQYLSESNEHIKALFSSLTGQYQTLIDEGKYSLSVSTIPLFNSARVEITFDKLNDNRSLETYSNTFIFLSR